MKHFAKKRFHLIGALVTIALMWASVLWMIESRASILRDGREVVLKATPVDPRDFLRGQYVRLNFDISRIDVPKFNAVFPDGDGSPYEGQDIYVTLEANSEGRHEFAELHLEKPEGGLFVKGVLNSAFKNNAGEGGGQVFIEYGIERFYAPETLAPDLESNMRGGAVTDIVVAVSDDGTSQIKALRQGERIFFTEVLY